MILTPDQAGRLAAASKYRREPETPREFRDRARYRLRAAGLWREIQAGATLTEEHRELLVLLRGR